MAVALAALAPAAARAQVTEAPRAELFPDPSKFAYGLYTQGDLGAVTVLGPAGPHVRPGWALGLAVGYDITRWLAIEVRGLGSTHLTDFPDAPQDGELVQLYHASAALKLSIRYRYIAVSADGSFGVMHTSTNVLEISGLNDKRNTPVFGGGLGFDYHTLSRHFAFGVHGEFLQAPGMANSHELVTTACVRYAF